MTSSKSPKRCNSQDLLPLTHRGNHMLVFIHQTTLQCTQAHQVPIVSFCDVTWPLSSWTTFWSAVFPQVTECSLQQATHLLLAPQQLSR